MLFKYPLFLKPFSMMTPSVRSYKPVLVAFYKAFLCGLIIILLSLISSQNVNKISFFHFKYADKAVHFLMYFGFTLFLCGGFKRFQPDSSITIYKKIVIIAVSVGFGLIMELSQLWFTTSRSGEILDFISNFSGALLAAFSYSIIIPWSKILKIIFE